MNTEDAAASNPERDSDSLDSDREPVRKRHKKKKKSMVCVSPNSSSEPLQIASPESDDRSLVQEAPRAKKLKKKKKKKKRSLLDQFAPKMD